jgi:hypothetical protein
MESRQLVWMKQLGIKGTEEGEEFESVVMKSGAMSKEAVVIGVKVERADEEQSRFWLED